MTDRPAQEDRPKQSTTNDTPVGPLSTLGGRKFALVLLCVVLYTFLLVAGFVGESTYLNLQVMTVGAFIAGNAVAKFAHARDSA